MSRTRTNYNANKTRCPKGHWLLKENLVPSLWEKRGQRACLTCQRAHTHIAGQRRKGIKVTWDEAVAYVAKRWPSMATEARVTPPD